MAIITGSSFDDILYTTAAADELTALSGNDIILVGLAVDYAAGEKLSGGLGYDRLWFHSTTASDTLVLAATATEIECIQIGDVVGNTSGTVALNVNASQLANGVLLVGNDGDNSLVGTARDDVIVGNGGVDTLTGGAGNDRIVMRVEAGALDAANAGSQSEGNTLALVGTAAGAIVVDLRVGGGGDQLTTIGGAGEAVVQSGFSHVDASALLGFGVSVTGTSGANILVGSAQGDVLEGGAGLDVVSGGAGDDVFLVSAGTDQLAGETVAGGTGTDVLRFTSLTAGQTLTLGPATTGLEQVEIASAAGVTTGTTALNVSAAGVKSGLILVGNDGANTLTGTALADVLNGNGGADTLYGGAGNDHYLVDSGADGVPGDRIVDSAGKEDLLFFTSTTNLDVLTLGATLTGIEAIYLSGEDKDLTGTATIGLDASAATTGVNVLGNDGANAITGSGRNDILTGGGGSDVIAALAGADIVVMDVDAASLDAADGGEAAEGNTLRLTGSAAGQIVINLAVAAGADQLLSIGGAGEALTQSDFTHVDAEGVVGFGIDVTGSALANTIVGTDKDDIIAGGLGIDTLKGGKGNDLFLIGSSVEHSAAEKMDGGDGYDTLRFTSAIAKQTLVLSALTTGLEEARISDAAGVTTGTTALNLNAVLVKSALILTGNDGNNTITGTALNDTLEGKGGADSLLGGLGNDTYVYAAATDLAAGERIIDVGGSDTLKFTSATPGETLVLSTGIVGVETFLLDGSATINIDGHLLAYGATFTGNSADNTIVGTARNDRIEGKGGNDTILAGAGDDTVVMSVDPADVDSIDAGSAIEGNTLALTGATNGAVYVDLSVAAGTDQLLDIAGSGDPLVQSDFRSVDASKLESIGTTISHYVWVIGSSAANTIVGSDGDDVFEPGLGADKVEGGKGADIWIVYSQAEYNGDTYTDNGDDNNDWLHFVGSAGQTLVLNNNTDGVDGAACGFLRSDTTNLNLNAAAVTHPFGLEGNAGDNILIATFNGESIFDYGGNDRMYGGDGDDDYVIMDQSYWTTSDLIVDKGGYDDVYFCDTGTGVMTVGRYVFGVERFIVSGADLADTGPYRRDNTTTNGAGIDASAQAGPIFLAGNNGANLLIGTRSADTIKGHGGQDTIVAGAGADVVYMEVTPGSVDAIDAGAMIEGNSLVLGGTPAGIVTIDLSAGDQVVSIDGVAEGLVQSGFTHVDAASVEGAGVDITGTTGANKLSGSAQDDVLRGGLGVDTLVGGAGNDVFVIGPVAEYSAGEVMKGGAGNDTVRFASTVAGQTLVLNPATATGLEAVEIASAGGDTSGTTALNVNLAAFANAMSLTGNDGNNVLYGTRFGDFLNGNGGADTLYGGAGNDVYLFDAGADSVALDKIVDTSGTADVMRFVSTTAADTLVLSSAISGVERLELSDRDGVLTGTTALNVSAAAMNVALKIYGNDGDNAITGTSKADTIYGNGGHDVIAGGAGADTIYMSLEAATLDDVDGGARAEGNLLVLSGTAAGAMVWDLSSDTDQLVSINGADEGRTFLGVTHLDAALVEAGAVTVTGSAEANTLTGTRFDDVFIVLAGAHITGDRISGGDGIDILRFASTTPGDSLLLGSAIKGIEEARIESAAGVSSGTAALNLNAAAVGSALTLSGNDGANAITGTAFDDDIEGRGGADSIVAGGGADMVRMRVEAADLDAADGGAIAEGNTLVLAGTAAGTMVVNLMAADQIVSINGIAEALLQSGFANVDASAVTTALSIAGTAADNLLQGGSGHDTLTGGAGADTITMDITAAAIDDIDAGAVSEGNTLILVGAAAGNVVIDLTLAGDQLTVIGDTRVQGGFANVDASAMTGGAVILTGTAAANNLSGTASADTIVAGGGADRITMDLGGGNFDAIDAGAGSEGDTLVLLGAAAGKLVFDLSVAPGADQLTSYGGGAEGVVQSGFQHIDASGLSGTASVDIRGNGANNLLNGTAHADTLAGLGGADTLDLGAADGAADKVVYESAADGFGSAAVGFSYDRILSFETAKDVIEFTAGFNGGINDLDDISADDTFVFANDAKANFSLTHEAMFLTAAKTKLTNAAVLHQSGFAAVLGAINKVGVQAVAGDDGLIAVQAGGSTGLYYYQESDGIANKVAAGELTLLGVVEGQLASSDLLFA